jgi:cell division protein FtsB
VKLKRRHGNEPPALRRLHALDGGGAKTTDGPAIEGPAADAPAAEGPGVTEERRADRPARPHRRRRILLAVWTTVVIVVAGLLLLLVLPTRAWLSQRSAIASAERRLAVLQAENAKLSARVAALQTPEEIERVARDQYNLAEPGEKVLSVLPAPALANLPSGWPFSLVNEIVAARSTPPPTAPSG